uniref:Uncharacterized protein n=1 Tax=Haemonchus contortus TaxID=6289 RepID=A0A7I4YL37_HAECO
MAPSKLYGSRVTMEAVPRNFAFLLDGSPFLQYCSAETHILFRRDYRESLQDWLVWLGGRRCPRPSTGCHKCQWTAVHHPRFHSELRGCAATVRRCDTEK